MKKKNLEGKNEKPFIKGVFLLQKYPGKGGWTYLSLPKTGELPRTPFGVRYVKGTIDDLSVKAMSIWSTKGGDLFFPVKAELRKKLEKQEGDTVKVVLFHDVPEVNVPADFEMVLREEPVAAKKFKALSPGRQSELVTWIEEAKKEETRINRMAEALKTLAGK